MSPKKLKINFHKKFNLPSSDQILHALNTPASYESLQADLDFRYDKKSKNFQIKTLSLNLFLKKIRPNDTCCLIGFTEYDLYVEDSDLFVAGLCNGNLGVGAFSIMRYHPKLNFSEENWFEYKQSKICDDKTWLMRSCRLMVHETCHLLGLAHCKYKDCCMNGSGHLKEDFKQSMFLCPIDLKKLWLILGFNLPERYENLKQFFVKNKCEKESKLLQKILKDLENFE
ncbi:unnamed protein product [Brachionus calyciflorus]|uniref:Archaemetzincin-2 n=1 Tax=Brachionus calyciflorus TaxID=104777 RepID=A0A813Q788_9BILA|nr:unnamed protein product [Brachionus calyciflorus]